MEERPWDRDEVADRMFKTPYESLSSWGKAHVNTIMSRFELSNTPRAATLTERNPLADNEKLAKQNEDLRLENYDLWDTNEDLLLQIEELKAEIQEITEKRNDKKIYSGGDSRDRENPAS